MKEKYGIFFLYKDNDVIPSQIKKYKTIIPIKIKECDYSRLIFNKRKLVIRKLPSFVILRDNVRIVYPIEQMIEVLNHAEYLERKIEEN